jgi:hypothetical protein
VAETTLAGIPLDLFTTTSHRVVTAIAGWFGTDVSGSAGVARSQQDGAWDATGRRLAREVELVGFVDESTGAEAHAVARALAALRPQSSYELSVTGAAEGTLSATVRVAAAPEIEWFGSERSFRYALTVVASDPTLYGPPTFNSASLATATPGAGLTYPLAYPLDWGVPPGVIPGALQLPNDGTVAYWPRLRIAGPVTNPTVSLAETGAWVRYNGTVGAGQWLDVDLAQRRVLLQGQVSVRHRVTSSGNWLAVPVGGGSITWTADTADPAALLSAWGYEKAVA